jgi:hypothetical protein
MLECTPLRIARVAVRARLDGISAPTHRSCALTALGLTHRQRTWRQKESVQAKGPIRSDKTAVSPWHHRVWTDAWPHSSNAGWRGTS